MHVAIVYILSQMSIYTHSHSLVVPQSPWCALGTIRENILFGKPYEETLYKKVIHSAALSSCVFLLLSVLPW